MIFNYTIDSDLFSLQNRFDSSIKEGSADVLKGLPMKYLGFMSQTVSAVATQLCS